MIIVGAGSAGKETSGIIIHESNEDIIFFDLACKEHKIWNKFQVITDINLLKDQISDNPYFCVAIGQPRKREKMYKSVSNLGALPKNIISKSAFSLSKINENGTIIQPGVCISFDVQIGISCIIHANTVIGHKVEIGNYVNISPLCSIVGPCKIGNYSYIGARSIIMPDIIIGKNSYITPGSIVDRDIKDYETF